MVNARCGHIRRLDYLLTSGALQSMTELSLGAGGGNCTNACVSVIASIKNTLTPTNLDPLSSFHTTLIDIQLLSDIVINLDALRKTL